MSTIGRVAQLRESACHHAQDLVGPRRAALGLDVGVEDERQVVGGARQTVQALVLLQDLSISRTTGARLRDLRSEVARAAVAEHEQTARRRGG